MEIEVVVKKGDITKENVDAIVNPSNSFGVMGGGVAYAIKQNGGVIIEEEAKAKAPIPVGEAILSGGGKLKSRYVIHASTMEHPAERIGVANIRMAVRAALMCAHTNCLHSISFPGMGTGVGGVPSVDAANCMMQEINHFCKENSNSTLHRIFLVAYSDELYDAFEKCVNLIPATK